MSEWQPIETAPRDGRELLMVCGDTVKVCYPKLFPRPIHGPNGTEDMSVSKPGDRWEYFRDDEVIPGHTWSIAPTHWMPLPEPPAQSTVGEVETKQPRI